MDPFVKAPAELYGGGVIRTLLAVPGLLTGCAGCSAETRDLTARREILLGLGVRQERICLHCELAATHRNRPGLDQALASVQAGGTLVVSKLDCLDRSASYARRHQATATTAPVLGH